MVLDLHDSLSQMLAKMGLRNLQDEQIKQLISYVALLIRWNARTNLTAVRDAHEILSRHILESVACAQLLPAEISTLLDFGSGAGLPGLPIAICRPEIDVTLAESQNKKGAFLREAIRETGVSVRVHAGRAELLHEVFNCVTLRAVDQMGRAIESASHLVSPGGWLAILTTHTEFPHIQTAAGETFAWSDLCALPGAEQRVLALGRLHDSLG